MKTPSAVLVLALVPALACGPGGGEVCGGLDGTPPTAEEAPDGRGTASLDGEPFNESGSWAPGPNGSVDIGTLTMITAFDETGTETGELIGRGAFPICVPLGERGPQSGSATWDGSYLTDASHTGMVAILDEEDGLLHGRFRVELQDQNSGDVVELTDGAFRVERR